MNSGNDYLSVFDENRKNSGYQLMEYMIDKTLLNKKISKTENGLTQAVADRRYNNSY